MKNPTQIALMALLIGGSLSGQAAEPLKVMFGQSRPPFVDEKTQSGIAVELMDEALKRMNREAKRQFAANKRMEYELKAGRIDIAVEVQNTHPHLFYSSPFIAYRNYAVSQNGVSYPNWKSMEGKSVCAWQNANDSLGPEFRKASGTFNDYREYPDQARQVLAWLSGRCEIILIDDTLLREHMRNLSSSMNLPLPDDKQLRFSPLKQAHELWWYVGFHSAALRDQFESALKSMKADGSYTRIREHYNTSTSR